MGLYGKISHIIGAVSGKYYFEDYIRVYPENIKFNKYGKRIKPEKNDLNNFLNHLKFYRFASQFIDSKHVADIGCGSGYGCDFMLKNGASSVSGTDISKAALQYARGKYGDKIKFTLQTAVDLKEYADDTFDVITCSEVLEHLKEYKKEEVAVSEMKRITKNNGLIILGTPNSELLKKHGFSYDEINAVFLKNFSEYIIFENAFIPFENKESWFERKEQHKTGFIVSQNIDMKESVLPRDTIAECKKGMTAVKDYNFNGVLIDLTLLHNTHSWIVIAKNGK